MGASRGDAVHVMGLIKCHSSARGCSLVPDRGECGGRFGPVRDEAKPAAARCRHEAYVLRPSGTRRLAGVADDLMRYGADPALGNSASCASIRFKNLKTMSRICFPQTPINSDM